MQDFKPKRPRPRRFWFRRRRQQAPAIRKSSPAALNTIPRRNASREGRLRRGLVALGALRLPRRIPGALVLTFGLLWLVPGTVANLWRIWDGPLTHVRVEGTEFLTPLQVAAAAGLRPGLALGGLDPLSVARRILEHPRIAQADVRRRFPGVLDVRIRERHPAALALLPGGGSALIDDERVVLERDPPPGQPELERLPRLLANGDSAVIGLRLSDEAVQSGLGLAQAIQKSGEMDGEAPRIDARDPFSWRVILPGGERELLLPARHAEAAWARFAESALALERASPGWRRADLRAAARQGVGWIALSR
jgi:cell division septal protein FtsQ